MTRLATVGGNRRWGGLTESTVGADKPIGGAGVRSCEVTGGPEKTTCSEASAIGER